MGGSVCICIICIGCIVSLVLLTLTQCPGAVAGALTPQISETVRWNALRMLLNDSLYALTT